MKRIKRIMGVIMSTILTASPLMSIPLNADDVILSNPLTITVSKSGGDFSEIQSAIDSIKKIPTEKNNVTILIKKGVYVEPVKVDIPYVTIKNASSDNPNDVIITYDRANGHIDLEKNFGTEKSATFTVTKNADNFSAENITFQNSYNLDDMQRKQTQAVALVSIADKVIFNNCNFIARQDTLYLKGATNHTDYQARAYLKNCYIEGTVDFIFGDATAYFDNCNLKMAYHEGGGHFTAANTTLYNTGYVFNKCTLSVDEKYNDTFKNKIDLGRPWQGDATHPIVGSETVFINCTMPKILNDERFSAWNSSTQTNKIRYAEYGSKTADGKPADTSKQNKWLRNLTEEQANSFTAYNVLSGKDGWNPSADKVAPIKVNSVTVDNCEISIPMGESQKISICVNPINAKDKALSYTTSNPVVATIDNEGNIKALATGTATITIESADNGFKAACTVNVTDARTPIPVIKEISIDKKDDFGINEILTGSYTYELPSDMTNDSAILRWYAIDDETGEKILLKEGNKKTSSTYVTKNNDINYKICFAVLPATKTTYGEYGEEVTFETDGKVKGDNPPTLFRTGFNNLSKWTISNSDGISPAFEIINDKGNSFATAVCDENKNISKLELNNKTFKNAIYEYRMRFNPELGGLNAESYFDIYTNYNELDKTYNKFRITRGGNTNSLRLYIYQKSKDSEEEILLAKEEDSLKDKVFQNSNNDNNFFRVKLTVLDKYAIFEVFMDNSDSATASFSAETENISEGKTFFEAYGKNRALLINTMTVSKTENNNSEKVRIYLAGDSTVKSYGDDNTIGGWGEFLPYYFDSNKVEIINKAEGGRSTRSYINQGRLDEILSEIRTGDYLFIQFGHNDARADDAAELEHKVALGTPDANGIYPTISGIRTKTPTALYEAHKNNDYVYSDKFYSYETGTYKWYLKQFIVGAREKGAIPVIITPVSQVKYDDDGKIGNQHGENGGYVTAAIQAAEENDCIYVDMYDITKKMYESYGNLVTQGMQNIKSDGTMDITHYNKFGSNIVASYLVKALAEKGLEVAKDEIVSSRFVAKTEDLKPSSVYIIGSSYAANYDSNPDYLIEPNGFGQHLQKYLASYAVVKNLAIDGATAKSFIKENNYKDFIDNLSEGDYVLIAFGENDGLKTTDDDILYKWSDSSKPKETKESFKYYLYNYYIKPAQDKKAIPMLVTPLAEGIVKNKEMEDNNSLYAEAVRDLVVELNLPWVNLNNESKAFFIKSGESGKNAFYAISKNDGIVSSYLNEYGAEKTAKIIISMFKASSATIKNYIDDSIFNNGAETMATKGEFIKIIMDTAQLTEEPTLNFPDVVKGKNYYNSIGTAVQKKIITDDITQNFCPDSLITKEQAEEILKNTLIYKGKINLTYKIAITKMEETLTLQDTYHLADIVYNAINKE